MSSYEYRVVPAPRQPAKGKGLRGGPEERYGHGLEQTLNAESRRGWEFHRVETVTAEIKRGWLSRPRPEAVSVMVFRRPVEPAYPDAPAELWNEPEAPARPAAQRRAAEPQLRAPGRE